MRWLVSCSLPRSSTGYRSVQQTRRQLLTQLPLGQMPNFSRVPLAAAVCPILCAAVDNVCQSRLFRNVKLLPGLTQTKPNKTKAFPPAWHAAAYKKRSRNSLAAEYRKRMQGWQFQVAIRRNLLPVAKPNAFRSGSA